MDDWLDGYYENKKVVESTIDISGSAGAPIDAEYIVGTSNGTLSSERVITDNSVISKNVSSPGQISFELVDGGITTSKIALNAVGNARSAKMPANTQKVNATSVLADAQDVAVPVNSFLGRDAGDIIAITFGTGVDIVAGVLRTSVYYDGTDFRGINDEVITVSAVWSYDSNVLAMGVVREDANGNLINKDGTIISGQPTVADWATLLSTYPAATNQYLHVLVTGIGPNGTLFMSNGTNWVPSQGSYLLGRATATVPYVVANSGITWTAATNAGKVRLTSSAAHGITAASNNAYMYLVSGGTGWVAKTKHKITFVDATHIDLPETDFVTSMGVPVFSLVNDDLVAAEYTVPPLTETSSIEAIQSMSNGGVGTKTIVWNLGGTEFLTNSQASGTNDYVKSICGIHNDGSASVQRSDFIFNSGIGLGNAATGSTVTGAVNTSVATTLKLIYRFAAPDEIIEHIIHRVEVFA